MTHKTQTRIRKVGKTLQAPFGIHTPLDALVLADILRTVFVDGSYLMLAAIPCYFVFRVAVGMMMSGEQEPFL